MTISLIIAGLLLFTIVPLPGGSAVDRIIKFKQQQRKDHPPALCDLQERSLTDPLLLEALRETDAVVPDSLPIEPREKLAEIAAEKARVAEQERLGREAQFFLEAQERVRREAAESARQHEEEQKRWFAEQQRKQEHAVAQARAKAAWLASCPEIPAISHHSVTVEEVETKSRLKREFRFTAEEVTQAAKQVEWGKKK